MNALTSRLHSKIVLDLTPGDGDAACVCAKKRIRYYGLAMTHEHAEQIRTVVRLAILADLSNPKSENKSDDVVQLMAKQQTKTVDKSVKKDKKDKNEKKRKAENKEKKAPEKDEQQKKKAKKDKAGDKSREKDEQKKKKAKNDKDGDKPPSKKTKSEKKAKSDDDDLSVSFLSSGDSHSSDWSE